MGSVFPTIKRESWNVICIYICVKTPVPTVVWGCLSRRGTHGFVHVVDIKNFGKREMKMDVITIGMQQHELITALILLAVLFSFCKFFGSYIDQWVAWKFKQRHGNECECLAMQTVREDVPMIIAKQKERDVVLANINTQLATNATVTNRLNENVDKLFTLFEELWKDEIKELRKQKGEHD